MMLISLDIRKVVMSSAPCDQCAVVALYGQDMQLAWCKCNDKKWSHNYASVSGIIDIIYHKGKLYAIRHLGEMFVFEDIGSTSS